MMPRTDPLSMEYLHIGRLYTITTLKEDCEHVVAMLINDSKVLLSTVEGYGLYIRYFIRDNETWMALSNLPSAVSPKVDKPLHK